MRANGGLDRAAIKHALPVIQAACRLAGPFSLIQQNSAALQRRGIVTAIRKHDNAALFDWLMEMLSFQGIADRVADQYIRDHGNVTWTVIRKDLRQECNCPQLGGFWTFDQCRYTKLTQTCSHPEHIGGCPLPRHSLRNGRLNQTAYSLYFFIRDVAGNDLVRWIDQQLTAAHSAGRSLDEMRDTLIFSLRGVYGISDKVISMALSALLMANRRRRLWAEVGTRFVVVDTLVHNFLHRTGILHRFQAGHAFGPACYGPNGCARLLDHLSAAIDARAFNPAFPETFPRFVQLSIWRYCSKSGFDICNGDRIDDLSACDNIYCRLRGRCDRLQLKAAQNARKTAQNQ